ncbi:MAG: citrate synthase [Halobacteriales archaeon]|jgi:citrate synthase
MRVDMTDEINRGLEGVVVDETELSVIDGDEGSLRYRGYSIEDLAREARHEEVLYLLWNGQLPDRNEYDAFVESMRAERAVDPDVIGAMRSLAEVDENPMAALRTGVSMLSAYDPDADVDPEDLGAAMRKGRRITAKIPTILAAYDRLRNGQEPVDPREDLSHAANFLYMLTGTEPEPVAVETFDMALVLHVDHGLNASTFTSMVISSTFADVYNAVTGGIGALAGPWHGGANQDVMNALFDLDESGKDPVEWVKSVMDEGGRVPGWGHRVYNVKDPRATLLQEKTAELAESSGEEKWYQYTKKIEEYLTDEVGLPEKDIAPNVDFFSGSVYYQLGIPIDLYTPIFAMSRAGGWIGHVLEYQEDNRLIRPRGRYIGADDETWVPMDDR